MGGNRGNTEKNGELGQLRGSRERRVRVPGGRQTLAGFCLLEGLYSPREQKESTFLVTFFIYVFIHLLLAFLGLFPSLSGQVAELY